MKNYTFDLSGKNAIVTGASGVLGGHMAEALIECGANVAMSYNTNSGPVDERVSRLSKLGSTLRGYKVNYMSPEEIAAHAEAVMEDFGRIDIVVNCAGGHPPGSISDGDLTFFDLDPLVMRGR